MPRLGPLCRRVGSRAAPTCLPSSGALRGSRRPFFWARPPPVGASRAGRLRNHREGRSETPAASVFRCFVSQKLALWYTVCGLARSLLAELGNPESFGPEVENFLKKLRVILNIFNIIKGLELLIRRSLVRIQVGEPSIQGLGVC